MEKPRVSVLVTFYNQEEYVDKAIESIISQKTSFGVHIIVGDDGSSDGTRDAVIRWADKYPDRIELHVWDRDASPVDNGFRASKNRLNLLRFVKTEYFIFLDGDDYYSFDGKLQMQADVLDDPANSDCIACGHNIDMLYKDGRIEPAMTYSVEGKLDAKRYWRKYYIHTDTLMIRSSVISHIDKEFPDNHFDDVVITFFVLGYGKIYYLPESWTVYVQTGNGLWTSGDTVVNLIRSMMMFDVCNAINPRLSVENQVRFSHIWKEIYRLRKKIDPDTLKPYADEAKSGNLKYTYKWIHYTESGLFDRIGLVFKCFGVKINKFFDRFYFRT